MRTSQVVQVVVFRAGAELYAIPLDAVVEIIPADRGGAENVLEIRGREVPMISASDCLGLDAHHEEVRGLLLHVGGGEIVIRVEHVVGVREIDREQIVPVPDHFRGRTTELVKGISTADGATVVVLRPEKLRTRRIGDDRGTAPGPGGEE
jgi:chemotaxis signal transduction protein